MAEEPPPETEGSAPLKTERDQCRSTHMGVRCGKRKGHLSTHSRTKGKVYYSWGS